MMHTELPWSPEVFNSPRQILTLLNKVPGYWLQGKTDLANKPRNMQIFPHSKFGINRTAASKVMAKKYNFGRRNFLAITFKPAVRSIPNLECGKICMFLGLFAKSVLPWSQWPGTLFSELKFGGESQKLLVFMVLQVKSLVMLSFPSLGFSVPKGAVHI